MGKTEELSKDSRGNCRHGQGCDGQASSWASIYLGGGAFGKVYKEWFNGQLCAVKKVPDHTTTDELMYREYEVYCTVNHQNVVKLVDRIEKHGHLWYIPMELINGQTLKNIMFHPMRSEFVVTLQHKSQIITGLCEGLLYLHNKSIIHRDLKPDNIMVEKGTLRPIIIDLGFAKFQYFGFHSTHDKGNLAYAAPETIHEPYTERNKKSDVWALGKIITELLVGHQIERSSPAHYQTLLRDHRGYCAPVTEMLDGSPIPRASMASVIGRIREAQGPRLVQNLPLQLYSSSKPEGAASMELYQELSLPAEMDLPPNFILPNPLPPNHTITLNYITEDSSGGFTQIKGEIQTRNSRLHHVWWIKCAPNALDIKCLPRYLK